MNHPDGPDSRLTEFISGFLKYIDLPANKVRFSSLAGDGSKRIFWRFISPQSESSFIAMENAPVDAFSRRENIAYFEIGRHLSQKGLPIPETYRFDLANGWFILEDLGDCNLQDRASLYNNRIPLYQKVVETLFRLQIEGSEGFNTEWCCQTKRYNRLVMLRYEADYFRDSLLCNYLGLKRDWSELEAPFDYLAATASKADSHFFLHRDFQSRNIMVLNGKMGILDWQGGRLGPLAYDLASLLIDPYTNLSIHEKDQIYNYYLQLLGDYRTGWVDPFKKYYPYLAIQRNLQILGAFSYLSKVQGKPYFEAYIPKALKSLHGLLDELNDPKLSSLKGLSNTLLHYDLYPPRVQGDL